MRITVRVMRADEAGRVTAMTRACTEAAQWSEADYAIFGSAAETWDGTGKCVLAATSGGELAGFAAVRTAADELEVLNLGVAPAHRRRGVGSALLVAAFDAAGIAGARAAFCEVRESNAVAQAFYEQHGFVRSGRRPRYYAHPIEDAIVMAKEMEKGK